MQLEVNELELVRQWLDSVQDVSPAYLKQQDYELARRIYQSLGRRVPGSMNGENDEA
jgi:hypothetical protein